MPLTAFFNVAINSVDSLPTTLKKYIILMSYNVMYGEHSRDGSNESWIGNFKLTYTNKAGIPNGTTDFPNGLSFTVVCSGPLNPNIYQVISGTIIDDKYADYINFGCFIYLYQFFRIIGMPNPSTPQNYSLNQYITGASNTPFCSWQYTTIALCNYIKYINYYINETIDWSNLINVDDQFSTISRMSYHFVNVQLLLSRGDVRLGMTSENCSNICSIIMPNQSSVITNVCRNLIQYEINQPSLSLTKGNTSFGTLQYPNNYTSSDHPNNPSFYYRQLSYMCFKQLGNSFASRGSDTTTNTYFENNDFGYFGLDNTSSKNLDNSLKYLTDTYNYTNYRNFNITGFGQGDANSNQNWANGVTSTWSGNNNPYFNFSLCSLHQMNYYLYLGI
jgi:hypothetical protein